MKSINLKKKLSIIISIVFLLVMVIILIILIIKPSSDSGEEKESILFKRPKNFNEIKFVSIRYNEGRDIITISSEDNYLIHYYGFDIEGNTIKNEDETDKININSNSIKKDVKKYIIKEVVPNLTRYKRGSNDWYITINVENASSTLRGKKGTEPDWFIKLLEKLEVKKYGNLSLKK